MKKRYEFPVHNKDWINEFREHHPNSSDCSSYSIPEYHGLIGIVVSTDPEMETFLKIRYNPIKIIHQQ